jgi:CDP-diacylglycerol--glycerol-3-phosphate 3-phosphatidyltransferase
MNRSEFINLPNILTISRIFLTVLFLGFLFADTWYWRSMAFVVFGLASLTDLYDGRLARSRAQVTGFGTFMDPLADKILVTSALVAFVLSRLVNSWLVVPIVMRDVLITGMRLYGVYHGRQMETSRLAKWKTTVQLVAVVVILFVTGLQEVLGEFNYDYLPMEAAWVPVLFNSLVATVLLLTLLSGLHYFYRAGFSFNES